MPFGIPPLLLESTAGFFLVFVRYSGLLLSAPLLSSNSFPVSLRVWFAFWLSAVSYPAIAHTVGPQFVDVFATMPTLIFSVFAEFALGWMLGLACGFVIWAAQLAGHFMSQEIGFAIGEVFDPVSESLAAPLATLFMTLGTLVFVLLDGPHLLFASVHKSLTLLPPGELYRLEGDNALFLVKEYGGKIWAIGMQMALPITFGLFLATVSMAILARTVPEMNIFILGFAVRIGLGLIALTVCVPFLVQFIASIQESLHYDVGAFLESLVGVVHVR